MMENMVKYLSPTSPPGKQEKGNTMIAAAMLGTMTLVAMTACLAIHAEERMKIVVTSFPLYDWTRQVIGETPNRFDLEFLQKNGTDLHSYQPTSIDLVKVAQCDLFVCIGGESDEWSKRALVQKDNPRRRTLNLLKVLGSAAKKEDDHDNAHHHDEEHDSPDEHIWLSLRHAAKLSAAIAKELSALDSLQSVDEAHAKTVTYLDVMTRNLATLKAALN